MIIRRISFAILLALASVLSGCMGTFKLTRAVYDWNGSSYDRWTREAMFLSCQVLPVYGAALTGDLLIYNLIEFWSPDAK